MIIDELYKQRCEQQSDINEHLPKLQELAKKVCRVTEFGVREGNSTIALASARPVRMTSYDINPMNKDLEKLLTNNTNFQFVLGDSTKVDIEPTDLLFIDTLHTYDQLLVELFRHHRNVSKYIVLHDTVSFGEIGENGGQGLKEAIKEFICGNPSQWQIKEEFTNNNGLTVLERKSNPYIEVFIPYEPCKHLGYAYNRAVDFAEDWVLLLDHDTFLCNPNWYEMCLHAIVSVGHKAGWISAVTNRSANGSQRAQNAPTSDNLVEHIQFAEQLFMKHGTELIEPPNPIFTGFFILTHRQAWYDVGGFDLMFHCDGNYAKNLIKLNYKMYVMPGLYVYHLQDEKNKHWLWNRWKNFGQPFQIL